MGKRLKKREEVKKAAFEYIEVFCRREQLHSTRGYKPLKRFLDEWLDGQPPEKLVA